MKPVIMLLGDLTKTSLENVWREVERYNELTKNTDEITLVLASGGGNAIKTLEFLARIEKTRFRFSAKIYQAESAAALIALTAKKREIVRGGIFKISLGWVEIETCDILDPEGQVPRRILLQAKQLRKKTFELLRSCGFPENGTLMQQLITRNHLALTADECLKLGIVERII